MTNEIDAAKEAAKAVQEVAKTTDSAIRAGEKLGSFIAKYTGESIENAIGIVNDKLRYYRWENQHKLMKKAEEFLKQEGLSSPDKPLQLKYAIPLLEAASLEEDEIIQDMWAKLLVNATNSKSDVSISRHFIDILERLTPIEANFVHTRYGHTLTDEDYNKIDPTILENYLPEERDVAILGQPTPEFELVLINLDRLGIIRLERTIGGTQIMHKAYNTLFGKAFYEACTLPSERQKRRS